MSEEVLEKENEKLRKKIEELEKEKQNLEKKVVDLEQQLSLFKNPHTPPSKRLFRKKIHQASKKLGAPTYHKGATREIPEPNETRNHFLIKCPKCDDFLGRPFDFEERIVEEIPEPQPVKVIKHRIGFYKS